MKHPLIVQWLAEGCVVQALPSPRGQRNALMLNRGVVVALLKLSESDYNELVASGPVSAAAEGGRPGGDGTATGDDGRGARKRAARRPGVGVVPVDDTSTDDAA